MKTTYEIQINNNTISVNEEEVLYLAQKVYESKYKEKSLPMTSPQKMKAYLDTVLRGRERERFFAVFLDTQNCIITSEILSVGSVNAATVYPREVASAALACSASCCIIAHNHPSNTNDPSPSDVAITKRIKEGLELLEIRLLDHFIITDNDILSFAERGIL